MLLDEFVVWQMYKARRDTLLEESRVEQMLRELRKAKPALWQRLALSLGNVMVSCGQGLKRAAGVSQCVQVSGVLETPRAGSI